jgi:hypothetical protein
MSSEKTNRVALYALPAFGGVALICLILWLCGVFTSPTAEQLKEAGMEDSPLGGSAGEVIYGK